MCNELQSYCEHAASALTVHPRVQTLLLTRPSALLQTGTTSEWMCGENTDDGAVRSRMEQEMEQERRLEGMGRKRFVLSADDDKELRSQCE